MSRWTTLFGALMLVLMLWSGSAAHAVEELNCNPVAAETIGHYEGDTDQVPADPDMGVAHHHAGCSGHQLAAPLDSMGLDIAITGVAKPYVRPLTGLPDVVPDAELRPPIA